MPMKTIVSKAAIAFSQRLKSGLAWDGKAFHASAITGLTTLVNSRIAPFGGGSAWSSFRKASIWD